MLFFISGATYFLLIVAIGIYLSKTKTKNTDESFYLADRSIGKFAGALSASASSESAWVILGLAGASYTSGLSVLWLIPGCALGYAFNWFVLAPKIRTESKVHSSITLPELLGKLSNSKSMRVTLAIITVVLLLAYTSAQFLAIGKNVSNFSSIDPQVGVIIGAIIVGVYLFFGGMRASIYTDIMQAIFMFVALLMIPLYGLFLFLYGTDVAVNTLPETFFQVTGGKAGFSLLGLILGWSGIGLAYPGQPHIHTRFMSMSDKADMKKAGIIAITWSTLVFSGAILGGIVGRYLLPDVTDPELILVDLAHHYVHPIVGGIVVAAVLSAIASTADSQLLTVSASLKNDFNINKNLNPKLYIIIIAIIGAIFATYLKTTIFSMVLNAWEILGVTVGTAVIGILLLNRSAFIVYIAMGAGLTTLFLWKYLFDLSSILYALIPASLISLVILLVAKKR